MGKLLTHESWEAEGKLFPCVHLCVFRGVSSCFRGWLTIGSTRPAFKRKSPPSPWAGAVTGSGDGWVTHRTYLALTVLEDSEVTSSHCFAVPSLIWQGQNDSQKSLALRASRQQDSTRRYLYRDTKQNCSFLLERCHGDTELYIGNSWETPWVPLPESALSSSPSTGSLFAMVSHGVLTQDVEVQNHRFEPKP